MTRGSWLAFIGMVVFTMGTSIVTPLFPLYHDQFNLSAGTITLLFATYTATVVPTMLLAGNLSDWLGRKRLILPAMATITAASLLFAFTTSVPMLFAGRFLQGLAIGMFLGVGAAFVVDGARPEKREVAALLAGVGFRLGFGLGPGLAGLLAQYGSDPIHRPFQWPAVLMVVGILAIVAAPETLKRRSGRSLKVRVGVPAGQFRAFATFIAPAGLLMSFLDATLLSLVPLYMVETLGVRNLAIVGLVGFLILATGGFAAVVFRRMEPRRAVITGVVASTIGSLLVVGASVTGTAALVILAAAVIGFTNGLILQGGTTICSCVVPMHERGKLVSSLYMCCYAGTVPSVALGYLSRAIGLTATMAVFSGVAGLIATFVLVVGRRNFREVIIYREPVPVGAEALPA
jgi:MFS family permease